MKLLLDARFFLFNHDTKKQLVEISNSDLIIQSSCCVAILRFINYIFENCREKIDSKTSMYQLSGEICLPASLIDIRNQISHQNLPTCNDLIDPLSSCLKYLESVVLRDQESCAENQRFSFIFMDHKNYCLMRNMRQLTILGLKVFLGYWFFLHHRVFEILILSHQGINIFWLDQGCPTCGPLNVWMQPTINLLIF